VNFLDTKIYIMQAQPQTPLLSWLIQEQADIPGKELAETAGIAAQTWSKVRQGKQDLSSELMWRVMHAIAYLRPSSNCARVVAIIQGKKYQNRRPSLLDMIEAADVDELEEAIVLIVKRLFPKDDDSRHPFVERDRIKYPIPH
jgi:predicted transcriptional regulator